MKFEEALTAMRAGAKISHPYFDADVYFQACRVGLKGIDYPVGDDISIVKMKGEFQHEDMRAGDLDDMFIPGTLIIKEKYLEPPCKHGKDPQLNLFLVMSDHWQIYEIK